MEPVEELEVQEFTIEEVEAVLSTDRDGDEVLDTLTRGEMKLAIRTGQFNEAELKAIEEASIFSAREIQILLSHPTALDTPPVSEHKSEKRKKIKKESSSTQLTSQIQQALVASKVGLTIDEICVAIGVLPEDFDPRDSGVRSTLKKFRALTRRVIDQHPDGDRQCSTGRNRLYSIGPITEVRSDPLPDASPEED